MSRKTWKENTGVVLPAAQHQYQGRARRGTVRHRLAL